LVVYRDINLAIAVDLDFEGLMTPVIRGADQMSVPDLARAIYGLATRARAGKLSLDEMAGATYTISNSGSYGTLFTASIINQPQVAILSTDGVKKRPVVVETNGKDEIAIRPIGVLAQSFDHRAFDGAYSAAFLKRLKDEIETNDWETELRGT
jgi:VCBS repeat-containing protein